MPIAMWKSTHISCCRIRSCFVNRMPLSVYRIALSHFTINSICFIIITCRVTAVFRILSAGGVAANLHMHSKNNPTLLCMAIKITKTEWCQQDAQLPQRDRASRYVSKYVLFYEVWELESFRTAKVIFKVIQWHWQWCNSIGHTRFPISVPW